MINCPIKQTTDGETISNKRVGKVPAVQICPSYLGKSGFLLCALLKKVFVAVFLIVNLSMED